MLLGGNAAKYPGPYKDRSKNLMGLTAVTTPNPTTVVFHLAKPFSDFNYVVTIPQTAPVPPNKDTGAKYQLHPMSTGPYKFQSYQLNKQAVLVPNPQWKAAEDPTVSQLASKIVVNMNMNPNDVDNRLLAGDAQVDFAGTGVQAAARAKILSNPSPQGQLGRPDHRVRLVLLHRLEGGAVHQRRLPPGDRVRSQPHDTAERLRRPGGGRRDREHRDAADRGPATRSSISMRRPRSRTATRPRPSRCSRPAVSRMVSRPGSPTGATGPPRRRAPRPCSRPCPRSGSRPRCTGTRPRPTTPTSLVSRST